MPKTKKGQQWLIFAAEVLDHVENYAVPQYGDTGSDGNIDWTAEECILAIKKYTTRFGKNVRSGQDKLDMMKIAHYACFAYNKLTEKEIKKHESQ